MPSERPGDDQYRCMNCFETRSGVSVSHWTECEECGASDWIRIEGPPDDLTLQDPEDGIAEAVEYPSVGEEITLRDGHGTAIVERVDRRRTRPVILHDAVFPAVELRQIEEYSKRVSDVQKPE